MVSKQEIRRRITITITIITTIATTIIIIIIRIRRRRRRPTEKNNNLNYLLFKSTYVRVSSQRGRHAACLLLRGILCRWNRNALK